MSVDEAIGETGPLALICGAGSLPLAVADIVSARGRKVLLFPLRGTADPSDYAHRPHHWVYIGQLGKFSRIARAAGCRDVAYIGALVRPALWQIRPDFQTLMLLPKIAAAFRGGDDHLLSGVSRLVAQHGFRVLGAHEVAPEILMPQGLLGSIKPTERDHADIALALDYLRTTGSFDVGQAVVVADKHFLAVEAAGGTDQMLAHVAELRANGRIRAPKGRGVLVKSAKSGQDRRFDLPSIGPQSVDGAMRAGLAGIAVAAGEAVIAEPARLAHAADAAKIFVVGVPSGTLR